MSKRKAKEEELLSSRYLDDLMFQRCLKWSKLMNDLNTLKEENEISLDDIEEVFCGEENEDEAFEGVSEAEEAGFNETIMQEDIEFCEKIKDARGNVTAQASRCGDKEKSWKHSTELNNDSKQVIFELNETMNDPEFRDMLSQTIPILEDQQEKWEKFGIEKVLNTFDLDKIKEKVSSYRELRDPYGVGALQKYKEKRYDSEDSLSSVDTPRYIRSSRDHTRKKKVCTTTTIKTFRTVESRRSMLRKKYHILSSDEEDCHIESDRIQHKQNLKALSRNGSCCSRHEEPGCLHSTTRKRHKVHDFCHSHRLVSFQDERSDSSSPNDTHGCSRKLPYNNARNAHCYDSKYRPHYKSSKYLSPLLDSSIDSPTLSEKSLDNNYRSRTGQAYEHSSLRKNHHMLYKLERECDCYHKKKLCSKVNHIANSSSEHWFVDSSVSPKKIRNKRKSIINRKHRNDLFDIENDPKSINEEKSNSRKTLFSEPSSDSEELQETIKPVRKLVESIKEKSNEYDGKKSLNEKRSKSSSKTREKDEAIEESTDKRKKTKRRVASATLDDKKQDAESSKSKVRKNPAGKKKDKNSNDMDDEVSSQPPETVPKNTRKPVKEKKKIEDSVSEESLDSISFIQNMEKAFAKSLESYEKENKKSEANIKKQRNVKKVKDDTKVKDDSIKTKTLTKPKLNICEIQPVEKSNISNQFLCGENTFLAGTKPICNSTALNLGSASIRNGDFVMQSQTATTTVPRKVPSSTVPSGQQKGSQIKFDDSDCFEVSSTSGNNLKPLTIENHHSESTGILLYAPNSKELAPASSYVKGHFYLTEDYLSNVIGKELSQRFLKHYRGRRRFKLSSTVYYKPSKKSFNLSNSTSDSDCDIFDKSNHYGEIHEIHSK